MPAIEHAFVAAQQVFSRVVTQKEAAERLEAEFGINVNSAKIMIAVYGKMVRGDVFRRALSAHDMNYYLGRLLAEGGPPALVNPTTALRQHIAYYDETHIGVPLIALRELYTTYAALCNGIRTMDEIEDEIVNTVALAGRLNAEERRRRAAEFPIQPRTRPVVVMAYERNPYVVLDVLNRARGLCEHCGNAAPFFRRRNNTPYLEVHHKVRLADGGPDTVENALALCPNCHRQSHYG